MKKPPPEFLEMLRRAGLAADETPDSRELTGGVASDIWRFDLGRGPVCVKRARAKLKVAQDWRAPVERNAYEAAWLEIAGGIVPGAAPKVLAHDPGAGMFAMEYLDPGQYPSWKDELLAGRADADFAARVGNRIAQIHAATAADDTIAAQFPTDAIFHAIRLAPYLEATAAAHPELAAALIDLSRVTGTTHAALVHGDVSPKNILAGPDGPVFLDAECAWYGDPAFDLAFCLNHLLLKCLALPEAAPGYLECFDALAGAYGEIVANGPLVDVEARAARLLPGLFLARIDGKSPVEYITDEADREKVRRAAGKLLSDPVSRLGDVRRAWADEL
ncbi:MAG: aminoglycoside phosphotransferase family protein [Proteobacteria bacterium]|nr:aminoglycoside phosphotransferase family protein [Pseudomonadota bacterium]